MEIDPTALSRSTTLADATATPSISAKGLPGASKDAQRSKTAPSVPRIDIEPFYADLKSQCSAEQWTEYKYIISQFMLGSLNQTELSIRVELLLKDPHLDNIHNQLVCGIYANTVRDVPDATVAQWVSANDKPAIIAKPPTGDAADQYLKREIMLLPPRIRNRIKAIRDEPSKPVTEMLVAQSQALTVNQGHDVRPSGLTTIDPSGAANTSGINRDIEIRRRYQQTLISEAHDLPESSSLNDRILPICFQEGLNSGTGNNESCADLISTALSIFVKDMVTSIVTRTRSNAPVSGPKPDATLGPPLVDGHHSDVAGTYGSGLDRSGLGIMTASYKRKLKKEDQAWRRGEIKRSDAGLLPVELQSLSEEGRGKCAPGDLRLAMELSPMYLRMLAPWQAERIIIDGESRYGERPLEEDGDGRRTRDDGERDPRGNRSVKRVKVNGYVETNGINGINDFHAEPMEVDEDLGWPGARKKDQKELMSLLDSCLDLG